MSTADQREIMERLRNIRKSRESSRNKPPHDFKVVPKPTKPIPKEPNKDETWFENAVESTKNDISKSKPPIPKTRTIVHDVSTTSNTSASEIITIVHRSKRTRQEKSIKTLKTRGCDAKTPDTSVEKVKLDESTETIILDKWPTLGSNLK